MNLKLTFLFIYKFISWSSICSLLCKKGDSVEKLENFGEAAISLEQSFMSLFHKLDDKGE
jgi:hypothetical protein